MTKEHMGGSSTIHEIMECARNRALLDAWYQIGDEVKLIVGTYEIDLQLHEADRFVRELLRNYENAMTQSAEG